MAFKPMRLEVPIIGILRGIKADRLAPLLHSAFAGGLQAIEVTMNTEGAAEMVAANINKVPEGKYLGMGTIRCLKEAHRAYDAGAMFFVTPNLHPEVLQFAASRNIPIIAGALSPSEVYRAWEAGALMVKVFPCRSLGGPRYIRELQGPFENIPLMAVGGVTINNIGDYFQAGAAAVGIGISLFGEGAVRREDWAAVGRNVKEFIRCCPKV